MGEATIPCLSGTKLFFYRHLTIRLQNYNEKKLSCQLKLQTIYQS